MPGFNVSIGHLEYVESPWGNAGGVVRTLEDVELMAKTGVGWIEAGSYTLEPRVGDNPNGEKVYHHDSEIGGTYNSLGMPNKGLDKVEKEIPEMVKIAHAHNKKLVVNVAPVSNDPVTETQELVARAYEAGADAALVNAGCPNVVTPDGRRHEILSYKPRVLMVVLRGLKAVSQKYNPVFVRLSPFPYANGHQRLQVSQALWIPGTVSAAFTPNTWPGHKPLNKDDEPILQVPGGIGGKSGPAMAAESAYETRLFAQHLSDTHVDVVSSSGIMNAAELQKRLDLGAVAAAGTTFYYESQNGWQDDTARLLTELAG